MMQYTIGFSPCPNDTFIFDAMVNHKIDTHGLNFEVTLEDVETLNEMALHQTLDFSKVSYGVLPLITENYQVLNAGSALGKGVGPLLISKLPVSFEKVRDCTIAIPGENTTAHMLFSQAFPEVRNKVFMRYDEIEDFVLRESDPVLGVIIHENRFTYFEKGLLKIVDLGNFWERKTGFPIPLGGIVGKRTLDGTLMAQVDLLIRQSIEYAFHHYPHLTDYVKCHAQEMQAEVMKKHIDLYVNQYSLALGQDGKKAIHQLISTYNQARGKSDSLLREEPPLFVPENSDALML